MSIIHPFRFAQTCCDRSNWSREKVGRHCEKRSDVAISLMVEQGVLGRKKLLSTDYSLLTNQKFSTFVCDICKNVAKNVYICIINRRKWNLYANYTR